MGATRVVSSRARFSTARLAPGDRLAFWREEIGRRFGFGDISCPAGGPFDARVDTVSIGALTFSVITADAQTVDRSARHIAQAEREVYTVGLLLEGRGVVEQDGRDARIGAHDIVLCSSERPYRIRLDTRFRQMVIHCDRSELEARLPDVGRRTATRIEGTSGLARATAAFLRTLHGQAPSLGAAGQAASEHALDLLASTLGGASLPAEGVGPAARRLLLARIRSFIEAHLSDPDLTPALIARHHLVSRRYLYGLFEDSGETVCGFIRRRRLARCRAALRDPREAGRSVSEIAFSWGFNDTSHFGRAFREAFGTTPRAHRRANV